MVKSFLELSVDDLLPWSDVRESFHISFSSENEYVSDYEVRPTFLCLLTSSHLLSVSFLFRRTGQELCYRLGAIRGLGLWPKNS